MPELIHDIAMRQFEAEGKAATDKGWRHGYTKIYDEVFEKLRDEPIKLLEIGVKRGASLRLWAEVFLNAEIFGIDINARCASHETDRFKIIIGDSCDSELIKEVSEYGPFDIIIDDGSHDMQPQKTTFSLLWPYVNKKGIYVIEDLFTSYNPNPHDPDRGIDNPDSTIAMLKGLVDGIHRHGAGPYDIDSISFYRKICFIKKVL